MNAYQKKLLEVYGGGDYAWLTHPEAAQATLDLNDCRSIEDYLVELGGDTLLLFLWRELGDDGDTSKDEYIARLETAMADIKSVLGHIEDMG